MSQPQTPYIGSKISLISKLDIRYEGTLFSVDSNESTIALSKVKSFGTEDRPSTHPVPGRDEVYEFIIFKASDIKDLIVCEAKPPPTIAGLPYDPAIVSVSQKQPQSGTQSKPVGSTAAAANEKRSSAFRPVTPTNPARATDSHGGSGAGRSYGHPRGNNAVPYVMPKADHPIPPLANPHQLPRYDHTTGRDQHRGTGGWEERGNTDYQRPLPNRQQRGYRQVHQAPDPLSTSYRQGGGWMSGQPRPRAAQSSTHQNKDTQKLQGDFDFEKANEKFEENLHHLTSALDRTNLLEEEGQVKNVDDQPEKPQQDASHHGESDEENEEEDEKDAYYDKTSSFFDKISCEALEKEEGRNNRPNCKKERMTNEETFGHSFFMRTQSGFRQRGGYGRPPYGQQRRYGHEGGGYSFGRMGGGNGYSRGPNNRRYPNQQRQPQATEG